MERDGCVVLCERLDPKEFLTCTAMYRNDLPDIMTRRNNLVTLRIHIPIAHVPIGMQEHSTQHTHTHTSPQIIHTPLEFPIGLFCPNPSPLPIPRRQRLPFANHL